LALVEAAAQLGGSVAVTADRHGVSRGLLFDWRRQVREGTMSGLVGTTADPTFAPVRVVPAPGTPVRPSAAAAPTRRSPPDGGMMELVLTNGRVLRVSEAIRPEVLGQFAAALEG
jgi:transposase